jgi:hypothetical protein
MAGLLKGMVGMLGQIASLLSGSVAMSLKLVNNLFLGGFRMVMQYNSAAMAFSRQVGLTAKQAQAYTEVLATRAKDLGAKYGIAAEEVTKLEQNLARATGRVLMLSSAEAERQVQLNRTVGEATTTDFTQAIMRTMGGQLSTVQGAVSKAYATAAKKGLDAAGMAAKVGQNLSMANRLTFKNGIDGITKMVALSEKLGFNMQSLESAANSFMDIQDAIESSAKLSMLGGAAGALGGNPLDMSYEANYDPEAFGERMTKILGGYAQFDEKTGMAKMNAMSRDFVKGIADAMHISLDEATAIAKKNAEVTYKNNRFGSTLDRMAMDENGNIDENKRDFLINKSQYNTATGQLEINGKALNYYQNNPKGQAELADMMKFNNMSDSEILAEQASTLVSIEDTLNGIVTSIFGNIAEKLAPHMEGIRKFLGDIYKMIEPHVTGIAENIKALVADALKPENMEKIKAGIETVINAIGRIAKFITSGWFPLLGAIFLTPMLGLVGKIAASVGGFGGANGGAKGKKGRTTKNRTWKQAKSDARLGMKGKKGLFAKGRSGLGTLLRNSRFARGASRSLGIVGTALAVGDAAYSVYDNIKRKEEIDNDASKTAAQKEEAKKQVNRDTSKSVGGGAGALAGGLGGAKIGAIIGTAIAPGIGTAIGGFLGGAIGGAAGYFGGEWVGGKAADVVQGKPEHHADGVASGAVGGKETPVTDKIKALLSESEMVFNEKDMIKAINRMEAKPVGGKEYIYVPQNTSTSTVGDNKITVNDINVRVEGTIRLDAGNAQKDIDINKLLDNHVFVSMLADKINTAINSNVNLKEMRDTMYLTGRGMSSTTVGRMMTTT